MRANDPSNCPPCSEKSTCLKCQFVFKLSTMVGEIFERYLTTLYTLTALKQHEHYNNNTNRKTKKTFILPFTKYKITKFQFKNTYFALAFKFNHVVIRIEASNAGNRHFFLCSEVVVEIVQLAFEGPRRSPLPLATFVEVEFVTSWCPRRSIFSDDFTKLVMSGMMSWIVDRIMAAQSSSSVYWLALAFSSSPGTFFPTNVRRCWCSRLRCYCFVSSRVSQLPRLSCIFLAYGEAKRQK